MQPASASRIRLSGGSNSAPSSAEFKAAFDQATQLFAGLVGMMSGMGAGIFFDDRKDKAKTDVARFVVGPEMLQGLKVARVIVPGSSTRFVFLPGAMVGLILAGVDPIDAVRVQAAVMFLILGSVATTTSVVAVGLARRLITPDGRVVRLTRSGG